jgi:hypothetical protein
MDIKQRADAAFGRSVRPDQKKMSEGWRDATRHSDVGANIRHASQHSV